MTSLANLFADIPMQLSDELFTTLLSAPNVRIERIISYGHVSPDDAWYDQDHHEWVLVLRGAVRLQFEEQTIELRPGETTGPLPA